MNRELNVIEMDLSNFMDEEEMRLTEVQFAQLDAILVKIHNLQDNLKARRQEAR